MAVSLTLTVLPAHAAASAPAGSTGYDISWPQCPSSFPAGGSFAIVGVTNGLAFSANPCLGAEYVWASGLQYAAGLYINTGNPETASSNWPGRAGGTFPRTCNTPAELADPSNVDCAYNYGWNAATDALNVATANVGPAALTLPWWLDVEIANSWNGIGGANSSTVQGYVDYLRGQGIGTVGIYSTGYQWGQITGGYTVASVPDWLAGASNVTQAASMCDPANSFSGGPVQLVQYPSGGFDGNYVCGVSVAQPDFSLSASPSSQTVTQGAGASYTITVTPTNGFTGTVALSAAGLPAGAAALYNPASVTTSATLTVTTASNTPTGTFTVTTTGSSGSLTHAAGVTLVVNAPADYSLSVSPNSVTVAAGSPASYTVSISRVGGFTGGVQFSTSALPAGAVASFSPNPGTTNSSTLSITTTTTTPPGTYPVTVTGTSGALSHTASPTLVVTSAAAGNYSLSATPSSRSITRGNSGSYTVTIARTGGFTGAVTFSVNGLPSGTSFSFSPNPSTGTGTTTTLKISTVQATPTGTYVLTITGVSGSMTRAVTVTMVVRRH